MFIILAWHSRMSISVRYTATGSLFGLSSKHNVHYLVHFFSAFFLSSACHAIDALHFVNQKRNFVFGDGVMWANRNMRWFEVTDPIQFDSIEPQPSEADAPRKRELEKELHRKWKCQFDLQMINLLIKRNVMFVQPSPSLYLWMDENRCSHKMSSLCTNICSVLSFHSFLEEDA